MKEAVVVDAVRTPIGRSHPERGIFRDVRSDDLAAACIAALIERTGIDPALVEDVLLGSTQQTGEQGMNVARTAALLAGLPVTAAGATVNRLCGSGLQALQQAAHAIAAGAQDVHVVGGLEHMHHLPMTHGLDVNPRLLRHTSRAALQMGITAEFLAQTRRISRRRQDEFAFRSHRLAAAARDAGHFAREIVPLPARDGRGRRFLADSDQGIRDDTGPEALAALEPAFVPGYGSVTAGNSSPVSDGAAALLVMSRQRADELGLRPRLRILATAVVGVEPAVMGTGPVPATRLALRRAGCALSDIDLIELNEAFAAQALACLDMLGLDDDTVQERVNVAGGAIALGHPLGASGARIVATLLGAMDRRQARLGLATMCIGVGQGIAAVFERLD